MHDFDHFDVLSLHFWPQEGIDRLGEPGDLPGCYNVPHEVSRAAIVRVVCDLGLIVRQIAVLDNVEGEGVLGGIGRLVTEVKVGDR